MCGIVGIVSTSCSREQLAIDIRAMISALRHRGPDGSGTWSETVGQGHATVCFGHTRLAIQDVSDSGAQPMQSASGRWSLLFNGEIYNFRELRRDLRGSGVTFNSGSDTEVLVEALDRWGIEGALPKIEGMFAIAAYDTEAGRLYLARDRAGEKPLYYGTISGRFVFSSTLSPLEALSFWDASISRTAVELLLRYRYVPGPYSIYEGVSKLPPGHFLSVRTDRSPFDANLQRYWSLDPEEAGVSLETAESAVDRLDELLGTVVSQQLISDRRLGAFLSGGVDSSLIAAMMTERAQGRVRTFTVAFEEPEFNEAEYARSVAEYLGTEHTEVVLPAATSLAQIPDLPLIYDEPFADASQLPSLLVSKVARDSVVVALSGDGGDESFAGYDRYFRTMSQWRAISRFPTALRRAAAKVFDQMAVGRAERISTSIMRTAWRSRDRRNAAPVFRRAASAMRANSILDLYRHELTMTRSSVGPAAEASLFLEHEAYESLRSDLRQMMSMDLHNYLPDDVLVKVDRASMWFGLESRAPLLDRRILEFAWRLPAHLLTGEDGRGKAPLRRLLERKIPRDLIDRPKRGFAVPMAEWLRTDLRDWAESLLTENRLNHYGLVQTPIVRERWQQHIDGVWDNSSVLWTVLQLQSWLEHHAK